MNRIRQAMGVIAAFSALVSSKSAEYVRKHAGAAIANRHHELARKRALAARKARRFAAAPARGPLPHRARLAALAHLEMKPGHKGVLWMATHAGHAGVGDTKREALGRLRRVLHESRTAL